MIDFLPHAARKSIVPAPLAAERRAVATVLFQEDPLPDFSSVLGNG
jgi:hypothetical protein